jgi:hypothetical protein
VAWSARLHPFAGLTVRASLCASLIPLLRGGDLPGIYAWIGMAFWPCALLLWLRRRELIPDTTAAQGLYRDDGQSNESTAEPSAAVDFRQ